MLENGPGEGAIHPKLPLKRWRSSSNYTLHWRGVGPVMPRAFRICATVSQLSEYLSARSANLLISSGVATNPKALAGCRFPKTILVPRNSPDVTTLEGQIFGLLATIQLTSRNRPSNTLSSEL